jgi:hypothetical protein
MRNEEKEIQILVGSKDTVQTERKTMLNQTHTVIPKWKSLLVVSATTDSIVTTTRESHSPRSQSSRFKAAIQPDAKASGTAIQITNATLPFISPLTSRITI